ncbi:MAG: outer membrane protein assembly factor BamB, partial [Gammaproteobacteria bacterium]|nr:outer membrane protein assembly factor BamB [Gammaproteobacteria bacterium]
MRRFITSLGVRFARVLVLGAALLSLAACGIFSKDDDPYPPADLEKFKAEFKVKNVWSKGIGGGTELLRLSLGPASNGQVIIAASHKGKVFAYEAENGRKLWSVKTKLPLAGGAGVDSRYVAIGSTDGTVVLLSLEDGKEIWRHEVASEVLAAPAMAPGQVIVRTVDGKITALSIKDGRELWFNQQSMPRLSLRGSSTPVVVAGAVICGFDNGRLAAYDLADGDALWDVMLAPPSGRTEIERLIDLDSSAVLVGKDVYAISFQGRLVSIAAESGQLLWSEELSSYAGIAANSSGVFVSTQGSELVAVSNASGRELWRSELLLNRDISGPALQGSS